MAHSDELRVMTKVARLYHEQALTQSQIAAQLHLSQATVSRLLRRAQEAQIIRITISVPPGAFPDLEEKLQARYGLRDVIVVDCAVAENPTREIGAAAAYYVETTLDQQEVIGISSWSGTLLAMVDAMNPLARRAPANVHGNEMHGNEVHGNGGHGNGGTQVVQILGGVGNPNAEVHAARLTGRLAALVNGTARYLPAPGVVGSAESVRVLRADPFVNEVYALFDRVTLALVGIGATMPSDLLASSGNSFAPGELAQLQAEGAVGDICLRFFDAAGNPLDTPMNDRVMGMQLQQLRQCRRAVGIAGGRRKVAAIRGALAGGWVNVLITDRYTAEALVTS
jgi:DNA-binding transcriptional regulator LsrR (DeoR family)